MTMLGGSPPPGMASPTPAAPPGTDASDQEAQAAALAAERRLEFRERHSLTIDAQAHTLLEPRFAREMRAVPLGVEGGQPVVAVADPSEKRLDAVRRLVGGETKFVLVAPESLDALLRSRIFNEDSGHHQPEGEMGTAVPVVETVPSAPRPEPEAVDVSADTEAHTTVAAPPPPAASAAEMFDASNVRQLAEQLAAAAETLIALQTQVQGIAAQFDQTRQELREQKERLAAAAAKADQDRARIRSVAASLAEDVARLDQTKADLAERLNGLVQED